MRLLQGVFAMEKFRHEKRRKEGLFDRAQLRQDDR